MWTTRSPSCDPYRGTVDHVLLWFAAFNTVLILLTLWGLRQARRAVDGLRVDVERLRSTPQ
jgi:hypothetical protein